MTGQIQQRGQEQSATADFYDGAVTQYWILVKNPESKRNRPGYLRIAVRDEKDNTTLVNALREILGE